MHYQILKWRCVSLVFILPTPAHPTPPPAPRSPTPLLQAERCTLALVSSVSFFYLDFVFFLIFHLRFLQKNQNQKNKLHGEKQLPRSGKSCKVTPVGRHRRDGKRPTNAGQPPEVSGAQIFKGPVVSIFPQLVRKLESVTCTVPEISLL